MSASHELKIIGVTLLDRSLKTYRELADDRRDVYPVVVTLSRPVHGPFELKFLFEELDIEIDKVDAMLALLPDTTLESVRDDIDMINANIANAIETARAAREEAEREDERLTNLAAEIDASLRPKR